MTEQFTPYAATAVCPEGHAFPATAGSCPEHPPARRVSSRAATMGQPGLQVVPSFVQAWAARFIQNKDTGAARRSAYGFGYTRKIGQVHHIPVCQADPRTGRTGLQVLTDYFNSGTAQGSTTYGNGRELADWLELGGVRAPFSWVHQYMPDHGPWSPWAQGIIQRSSACGIPPSPAIAGMLPGEPNEAFDSVENVAVAGTDLLTDPQFNSNAMLRALSAARNGYPITPLTQLWHAEVDQRDRCFDPGWPGELEDALQEAARRLLMNDPSGLRGTEPVTPPVDPARERIRALEDALTVQATALDDLAARATIQAQNLRAVLRG